jgi:TetR/AcrR family transcriptional regulator
MIAAKTKQEPEAGARERLLDAALNLFNDRGYAASSVREIVQAAGVTKPVLYYYFGNKEGLYLELMQSSYHTFESVAEDIGALDGCAQDKVIHFCTALLQTSLERLPLVRLMYAIYYGPPQGAPHFDLEVFMVRMLEVVRQMVAEGVASGEFRENRSEDVARTIIAIVSSTINEQLSRRENKPDAETMVRMLRLLMTGIASR